jgi:hypothetical protein
VICSDADLCDDCRDECGEVVEAMGYVRLANGRYLNVCAAHAHDYDFEPAPKPHLKPYRISQERYVAPWPSPLPKLHQIG